VAQRVWRHPRGLGSGTDSAAELAADSGAIESRPGNRRDLPAAAGYAADPPATRRAAVGAAAATTSRDDPWPVAALDAQQHALGIDIADLERDNLRDAQSSAVRNAWRHTAGEQSALNGAIRSYCTNRTPPSSVKRRVQFGSDKTVSVPRPSKTI